jgi:hypothetical protein
LNPYGMTFEVPMLIIFHIIWRRYEMTWLKIKNWFLDYNTLLFLLFIALGWLISWIGVIIYMAIVLK